MSKVDLPGIESYVQDLFIEEDPALEAALSDAKEAGLPEIQVSALQGRLLYLIAAVSGARRMLEIGTLGGYSGIHFARALPEEGKEEREGKLISLELSERHAEVARKNFERAGLAKKVEVRVGDAKKTLRDMVAFGEPPFDLVFIDAEKEGYSEYLDLAIELSRPGTVIIADNTIRGGAVINPGSENGRMMDEFNRKFASHERLDGTIIPMLKKGIDGIAVARVSG
ncbi:MAG: O-methyltransferase [Rubrobacter sp.]